MSRIPETPAEYRRRHLRNGKSRRKCKSIAWAIKYYNDNYIYTEWEKPPGKYVKKGTDRRKGFRRRNRLLNEQLSMNNYQLSIGDEELISDVHNRHDELVSASQI